jgi:hypothetical protein
MILLAAIFTGCEKKGQAEFELGQAAIVAQDYKTAIMQFALAANKGHVEAQYQIGVCYAEGKGVEWDLAEAVKWYRKAAEQGHAPAQLNLGLCYYDGNGDSSGLECDAVLHLRSGSYGLIEIKLGGDERIAEGVKNLQALSQKIDSERMNRPAFLMVLTGIGDYAYRRKDGVYIVPIGCLG